MTDPAPLAPTRGDRLPFGRIARSPAWVPFGAMALAQIAIPLTSHDPTIEWLSSLVVVCFFLTTVALVAGRWGWSRTAAATGCMVVATTVAEKVGTSTGFPFGEYTYTGALSPAVAGVPVIVPLAWFAMGVPALMVGRAIVAGWAVPTGRAVRRVLTIVVGSLALTAWDLFLDPQMVDAGYWEWAVDGRYHGIPWSNYLGWLGLGFVVLALVDRILVTDDEVTQAAGGSPKPIAASRHTDGSGLLGLYTWWAVMNTIGFVVFFGEPGVGLVGGTAMLSLTALAWRATSAGRRR